MPVEVSWRNRGAVPVEIAIMIYRDDWNAVDEWLEFGECE